jgi:hypothetical protein
MIRSFWFALICSVLSIAIHAEPSSPLRVTEQTSAYRPSEYPIDERDGRVFFSQYDKSGNNFDVIGLNITDQSTEFVVRGRHGARFVAQSDKFVIFQERTPLTAPLVVVDRATGRRLKELKLQRLISWAKIDGDRLIAIQGSGGGYAHVALALIFELPSLKIIKSVEIIGGNDTKWWDGKILSLGYELAAYDTNLNPLFKISLPQRKTGESANCAATIPLRVFGDKAVIVANCGDILVYNLASRQLERTIPGYAHFYAVTIMDGLIFTSPTSEPRLKDNAHVYDLNSGEELAVLPINATDLFSNGDRLLAVERKFGHPSPMSFYSVDVSVLRSGQWRIDTILAGCKRGRSLIDSADLYGGIEACKATGIDGLARGPNVPNSIVHVMREYAGWLAQTLDRTRDAKAMLERLMKIAPLPETDHLLSIVELKGRVLEGDEVGPMTPNQAESEFGRALINRDRITNAQTKDINFGAFSNLFYFFGNNVYVGGYGCGAGCTLGGASLSVLDRATFDEIASIPIVADNEDYQDEIVSIAGHKNKIYLALSYRYEQAGRPDFVVVNKSPLMISKRIQAGIPGTLKVHDGKLFACGCHFTQDQTCKTVDPETGKSEVAPGALCAVSDGANDSAIIVLPPDKVPRSPVVALTRDYLVARASRPEDAPYIVYSRTNGTTVGEIHLGDKDSLSWPTTIEGNTVVVAERVPQGQLIKAITLPAGSAKTLFGVPTSMSRFPVPLLTNQTLFVGFGRDLMIFDLRSNRLRRYIKNFTAPQFEDNGFGLDKNRINKLIVDNGRLVAITFYGKNSQIVPLSELSFDQPDSVSRH